MAIPAVGTILSIALIAARIGDHLARGGLALLTELAGAPQLGGEGGETEMYRCLRLILPLKNSMNSY